MRKVGGGTIMTRAILTCFHAYTPFGIEFYEPLLDFYLQQMKKFSEEYDMIYLIEDDNWRIDPEKLAGMKAKIVRVDSQLRYWDAFKAVLPQVEEDLTLFLDDDMVIYESGEIRKAFIPLMPLSEGAIDLTDYLPYDVVSIMDTIGTYTTDKLKRGNKFCPYLFASRKDLLMKYLEIDWAPDMPYCETLGHLTEAMLKDDCRVYEMEDDKTEVHWIESPGEIETDKTLGYYHIRAGSTPAYLLATKHYGNPHTYWEYLKNQPTGELLRHCAWYRWLGGNPREILEDLK